MAGDVREEVGRRRPAGRARRTRRAARTSRGPPRRWCWTTSACGNRCPDACGTGPAAGARPSRSRATQSSACASPAAPSSSSERTRHVGEPARHRGGDQPACAPSTRRQVHAAPSTWRGAARRTSRRAASPLYRSDACRSGPRTPPAARAGARAPRSRRAREHPRGHLVHAADADVPLGLRRLTADDERVRGHHRRAAGRSPRAPTSARTRPHRRGMHRLVRPGRAARGPSAESRTRAKSGSRYGIAVDRARRRASGRRDAQHRLREPGDPGTQPDPVPHERRPEAQPRRRVVVAGRDARRWCARRAARACPRGASRPRPGGIARSYTSPATTTASTSSERTTSTRCVEVRRLVVEQIDPVQRPAQVPVRRVQQPHASNVPAHRHDLRDRPRTDRSGRARAQNDQRVTRRATG